MRYCLLLFLTLPVLAGCALGASPAPAATPVPVTDAAPADAPRPTLAAAVLPPAAPQRETYSAAEGFAFEYPADWYFRDWQAGQFYGYTVSSFAPDAEPPHAAWALPPQPAEVKFAIVPPALAPGTLDAWIPEYRDGLTSALLEITSEGALTLPSGIPAYRFTVVSGSGWVMVEHLFIVNSFNVVATARGEATLIEGVVNTIRPT